MSMNDNVQSKLSEAIALLEAMDPKHKYDEIELALVSLTLIKKFSASNNGIPSLRGQGLEKALALADEIIAHGVGKLKLNFRSLSESLTY